MITRCKGNWTPDCHKKPKYKFTEGGKVWMTECRLIDDLLNLEPKPMISDGICEDCDRLYRAVNGMKPAKERE